MSGTGHTGSNERNNMHNELTESYWPQDTSASLLDTHVGSVLEASQAANPDGIAFIGGDLDGDPTILTYSELLDQARRLARVLAHRFDQGDRVAMWASNIPEWVMVEFAAGLAGITLVTVNPGYQPDELRYVLDQSEASGIIYELAFRGNPMKQHLEQVAPDLPLLRHQISIDELRELAHDATGSSSAGPDRVVKPTDAAQIQYTSGTTGFPKGAQLHHLGITNNARLFGDRLGFSDSTVCVSGMPLFHTGGCVLGVLGVLQAGGTLVQLQQFDPGVTLRAIERYRATHLTGVPSMLIACMEHPDFDTFDLSSLEVVCAGGSTVPAELVRRIEKTLGVAFCIVYGQTEASPAITLARQDDSPTDKAETLGPPLPQVEMKIIDPETGETTPVGVPGELCARGYQVMLGYYNMPDKTAEAIDADGWLHTGDLAFLDSRGYATITGRLKDMIIRGGENIYPREIEEVLFKHPAVAEVAVTGIPDHKLGEIVVAFIRDADPENPASDQELLRHCREVLAAQKTPSRWERVTSFPMTSSGKIQKFALAEQITGADSDR